MTQSSGTSGSTPRPAGQRRAPPSGVPDDRRSRIWALAVPGIFVLILVLALIGIPSRLFPQPTPEPLPSIPAPVTAAPTGSPGTTGPATGSPAATGATATPSVQASPSPEPLD